MIKTENVTIKGRAFVRTYSDEGYMIERDGMRYVDAVDPEAFGRTYTETDEPIEDPDEATDADYQTALEEMGCSFDD